jgi:hypothetical protein
MIAIHELIELRSQPTRIKGIKGGGSKTLVTYIIYVIYIYMCIYIYTL